ncbi:MAG: energy transducer TonB [Endomicrobiales bacterium]
MHKIKQDEGKVISNVELMEVTSIPSQVRMPVQSKAKLWDHIVHALSIPVPAATRSKNEICTDQKSAPPPQKMTGGQDQASAQSALHEQADVLLRNSKKHPQILDVAGNQGNSAKEMVTKDTAGRTAAYPVLKDKSMPEDVGTKHMSSNDSDIIDRQRMPSSAQVFDVPLRDRSPSGTLTENQTGGGVATVAKNSMRAPSTPALKEKDFVEDGIEDAAYQPKRAATNQEIIMPKLAMRTPVEELQKNDIDPAREIAVAKRPTEQNTFSESKRSPMKISGPLEKRKVLAAAMPAYPQWARKKGVEANVSLKFFVSPAGSVLPNIFIMQTSGYGDLDQECMNYVRKWVFAPLTSAEPQSEQWGIITIRFKLE